MVSFNEWLQEVEGFSSRAERLYDDFLEVKDLGKLRRWMEAAYLAGIDKGFKEEGLGVYKKVHSKLVSLYPDKYPDEPFICGRDQRSEPPEHLLVCPAYGSDVIYRYVLQGVAPNKG